MYVRVFVGSLKFHPLTKCLHINYFCRTVSARDQDYKIYRLLHNDEFDDDFVALPFTRNKKWYKEKLVIITGVDLFGGVVGELYETMPPVESIDIVSWAEKLKNLKTNNQFLNSWEKDVYNEIVARRCKCKQPQIFIS